MAEEIKNKKRFKAQFEAKEKKAKKWAARQRAKEAGK